MSEVLYRKYRPRSFDEIVGQRHIVSVLKAAIVKNRISHAYLFSGPRGTGKTTIARVFSRAVNCTKPDLEETLKSDFKKPCNKCDVCKEFLDGRTLDMIEIDAASSRGIDEIRVLKEAIGTLPFRAKYKVYIIDEVHMLTKEAFNALLKTLEEPPEHVIFILATTEIDKVLETIISRTQHFEFRKIPEIEIQEALGKVASEEKIKAEADALGIIALLADGSLRDAQSMLDQALSLGLSQVTADSVREIFGVPSGEHVKKIILALTEKNAKDAFSVIQECVSESLDMKIFFKLLLRNFRHALYLKIIPNYKKQLEMLVSENEMDFFSDLSSKYEAGDFERALRELDAAYPHLKISYLPQLPLELAVLKITG